MAEKLPAPQNKAIDAAKAVLDKLVEGVGVDLAVSAGQSAWPFLALPVVRWVFKFIVVQIAEALNDDFLFPWTVKFIIRIQSSALKKEYNAALQPIIQGSATDEELQRIKDAADAIINRNR